MPERHLPFRIEDFGLGLNTRDPAYKLPAGAATVADDVWLYKNALQRPPGWQRLTGAPLPAAAVLLDGLRFFRAEEDAATSLLSLRPASDEATFEIAFRSDSVREIQTIAAKGNGTIASSGTFAANFDWWLFIGQDSSWDLIAGLIWSDGTSISVVTTDPLEFRAGYRIAVALEHDTGAPGTTATIYWRKIGQAGAPASNTAPGILMANRAFDIYLGGNRSTSPVTIDQFGQKQLHGVVQDVRVYDDLRTINEIELWADRQLDATEQADANLLCYYPLTGDGPVEFDDALGAGPVFRVELTDHRRRNLGHPTTSPGAANIEFDGRDDGFAIPESYRYRKAMTNDDGEYPMRDSFAINLTSHVDVPGALDTLVHFTHVPGTDFTTTQTSYSGTFTGLSTDGGAPVLAEQAQFVIDLVNYGGGTLWQYRAIVYFDDGEWAMVRTDIAGGISSAGNTIYDLMFVRQNDAGGQSVRWIVDGVDPAVPGVDFVDTSTLPSQDLYRTPNDPVGSGVKYLLRIGQNLKRVRKRSDNDADPDNVGFEIDFSRCYDGTIDNLTIMSLDEFGASSVGFIASFLAEKQFDRTTVDSVQATVLSSYSFDEVGGPQVLDAGQLQNHLLLKSDPGHLRGASLIETNDHTLIHGIMEHRYVQPGSGEQRKVIVIGDHGATAMDPLSGVLTPFAEGFRNDDRNLVSHVQYRDGRIIVSGSGAGAHLHRENFFRLSIEPQDGTFFPFGLTDQNTEAGRLTRGRYLYAWRFFSRITGKYSPVFGFTVVNVMSDNANVLWGTSAEINQTAASAPLGAITGGALPAGTTRLKEPYDLDTPLTGNKVQMRFQGWDSATEGGPAAATPDPPYLLAKFKKNSTWSTLIEETESVKIDEIRRILEAVPDSERRAFVSPRGDGTFDIKSAAVGSTARLRIADRSGATATEALLHAFFNIGSANHALPNSTATEYFIGSGVTSHGLGIPFSTDPQTTDVELCRSTVDGTDLRVLMRVSNGETELKDNVPDDLNTGEVVDLSLIEVPPTRYVTLLGNRMLYFGDPSNPQRAYLTPPDNPFLVPSFGVIDFLEGRTSALTGAAGTEDQVFLFKDDTTFVLTPIQNPVFPFQVNVRLRDTGALSHFAVIPVRQSVLYPEEQGFQLLDAGLPAYISRGLETTWQALSKAARGKIVGVHFVDHEALLWAVASGNTTVNDEIVNDQVFALFYRQPPGWGWTRLPNMPVRLFSLVSGPNDEDVVLFADHFGFVNRFDLGDTFGLGSNAAPITAHTLTVQSGTNDTTHVTVAAASTGTLERGYIGLYVTLVKADGTRQTRLVVADTQASPSVLTLTPALSVAPVIGDTLLVGSIESRWVSGDLLLDGQEGFPKLRNILVRQKVQSTAALLTIGWKGKGYLAAVTGPDGDLRYKNFGNAVEEDVAIGVDQNNRGNRFVVELLAQGIAKPFEIHGLSFDWEREGKGAFKATV